MKCKVLVLTVNTFKLYIELLYMDFQVSWLFCTSMSLKKTLFNENWLNDSQFSSWIARSICKDKACCKVCATNFQLGNMGKQALIVIYFFCYLLINKYTKHKLTIIRCQSQRLIWRRSESYNVLLSYNENKN